jgi:hypothetical protein
MNPAGARSDASSRMYGREFACLTTSTIDSDFPSEATLTKPPSSASPPAIASPPVIAPTPIIAPTPVIAPLRSTPRQGSIEPFLTPRIMFASIICAFAVGIGVGSTWNGSPGEVRPTAITTSSQSDSPSAQAPTSSIPVVRGPERSLAAAVSTAPVDGGSRPAQPAAPQVKTPARPARTTGAMPKPVFQGTLVLNSSPPGALVSLDGASVGKTPLVLTRVRAGSRVVRMTANGRQPWSVAVRVVANERNIVRAVLDPAR